MYVPGPAIVRNTGLFVTMIGLTRVIKNGNRRTMIIRDGIDTAGKVFWETEGRNVFLLFDLSGLNDEDLNDIMPGIINQIIRTDHPLRIYTAEENERIRQVLMRNSFSVNGELLYMNVEPWRYRVEDRVFDEQGYIINQGQMDRLPYGAFSTRTRGCGWISAYNLLKYTGRPMTMQKIAEELEKRSFTGNVLGTNGIVLYRWLKSKGLPVRMVHLSRKRCAEKMNDSECGILLYVHRRGGHYTCYRTNGNGTLHFWNAVYGKKNLDTDADTFLAKYTFLPFSWLIYIPKGELPVV